MGSRSQLMFLHARDTNMLQTHCASFPDPSTASLRLKTSQNQSDQCQQHTGSTVTLSVTVGNAECPQTTTRVPAAFYSGGKKFLDTLKVGLNPIKCFAS